MFLDLPKLERLNGSSLAQLTLNLAYPVLTMSVSVANIAAVLGGHAEFRKVGLHQHLGCSVQPASGIRAFPLLLCCNEP